MIRLFLGLGAAMATAVSNLPASAHYGSGATHLFTEADHITLLAGTVVVAIIALVVWRISRD